MKVTPIKTRLVRPPEDKIWDILDEVAQQLSEERSVVCISSKIAAMHEGHTVPAKEDVLAHKDELAKEEADAYIERGDSGNNIMFTQIFGAIMPSAGIDASNADSHLILLPRDPMQTAFEMRKYLIEKSGLHQLAVLLVDSETVPLRWGAIGYSVGWCGMEPHYDYRGQKDLFDQTLKVSRSNDVDGLAAAAVFAMGEASEQTPVALIEGIPDRIHFTQPEAPESPKRHFVSPKMDIYRPMLNAFNWIRRGQDKK